MREEPLFAPPAGLSAARPDWIQTATAPRGHHLNASSAFFQQQTPDSRRCFHKKTPHCAQFYFSMDQKILMRETGIKKPEVVNQILFIQ